MWERQVDAFACLTGDVVGQYAFAKPYGLLDDPDFSPYWHKLMMDVSENTHLLKQFGWLVSRAFSTRFDISGLLWLGRHVSQAIGL